MLAERRGIGVDGQPAPMHDDRQFTSPARNITRWIDGIWYDVGEDNVDLYAVKDV